MTLNDLIARVEKAKGPDRELDEAILAVLFLREDRHIGTEEEQDDGSFAPIKQPVWVDPSTGRWVSTHAHRYTASLDAALSLVPEGYDWILERTNGGLTIGARVGHNDPDRTSWGDTPELALCAAALRAREARDG